MHSPKVVGALPDKSCTGYQSHALTYASELIQCAHCGHPITGEQKTKMTKNGERFYNFYPCTYCNVKGHPRVRVTEAEP